MIALGSSFPSALFAGTERGSRLVSEAGGAAGVPGIAGPPGTPGLAGIPGINGIPGAPGVIGVTGDQGIQGIAGVAGIAGDQGIAGAVGTTGIPGSQGIAGIQGIQGIPGSPGVLDFADFFALMPPDNAATIAPGTAIQFPRDGFSNGGVSPIIRLNSSTFQLPFAGTYLVLFQTSVTEPGQLMLRLNGTNIVVDSTVGRATGTSQIVGMSIVRTFTPNNTLEVINPPGNATALTLTPLAGGTLSVSAHLTIIRIL